MPPDPTIIECPRCRLISPAGAERCECGWDLVANSVPHFRSGSEVVVGDCGTLPPRCVKCNAAAGGPPIKFTFADSVVGGAPRGVITTLLHFGTRRTGRVYLSLCERHRRVRKLIRVGGPVLILLGIVLGVYGSAAFERPPNVLFVVSMILFFAGLLPLGIYEQHYLKGRVVAREVWISGAGDAFLESLPRDRAAYANEARMTQQQ